MEDEQLKTKSITTSNNTNEITVTEANECPTTTSILSVVVEDGTRIAFACYHEHTNDILLEYHPRIQDSQVEEIIERFYAVGRPTLVLVSPKTASQESWLQVLTRPPPEAPPLLEENETSCGNNLANLSHDHLILSSLPYKILRTSAFDIRNCQSTILNQLRVLDLLRNSQRSVHSLMASYMEPSSYHSISAIVDFDQPVLVKALGSLLSFLQTTLFRLEEGNTVTVNSIRQANSSMFMRISTSTLSTLHIFSTEHHPLLAKGQGHSKEGFSLFSLLDRTKSKMGRDCLRNWMLQPLVDQEAIEKRYDGVEMFLRSEFQVFTGALVTQIEKVGRIDRVLMRMSKCLTTGRDFTTLLRSLSAALVIFNVLEADFIPALTSLIHNLRNDEASRDDVAKFQRYLQFVNNTYSNCNKQSLRDVHHRITSIVDDEAITEECDSNIPVKIGFHEDLDYAKEKFDSLDTILSNAAKQVLLEHSRLLNLTAVFLHQLGFLVVLNKQQHRYDEATNSFLDLPPEFHCVFTNLNEAYFKTSLMKELDDTIGDVHGFILDTERMIISELEEDILDHENELRATFHAISEMDCILCFAACADDLNFVRPKLVEPRERCIMIKNGRHPLQEAIIEGVYVPNDTFLDSRNRVSIVTGPNFSGKSCYTRQVGVIVYMAQIGSFVPADEATISITDQILARIATVETCAVPQSSFQLEMSQMAGILRNATAFSLVLIDEFGKGTSPTSGIAVLTAVLKHLAILKCKVICTTHFLEIFSLNLVCDGVAAMKAFQMQVEFPKGNDDQAKPLFKLVPGVAKASAGIACAENAGLNEEIVARAGEVLGAIQSGTPIHPDQEICNPPLVLSSDAKEALEIFLGVENWREASEESLRRLMHHIARM